MIHLHTDEHIEIIRRKHWFVLLTSVFPLVLILFLPLILWRLTVGLELSDNIVSQIFPQGAPEITTPLIIFFSAWWAFLIWIKIFIVWTDYYLDAWVITNKRILDIEQIGFFKRKVSTFRFKQIQDITVDVRGLIPTLLDFGTIHVQTAGEKSELLIKNVANPNNLRDFISRKHDQIPTYADNGPTYTKP